MGLRNKLIAIYVVAGLIVAVGVLAAWGLLRLQKATDWTLHTRDVIASVDAVVADLASAESALRAYQATGDSSYLVLLGGFPAATEEQLQRLERLAGGNVDQRARVVALSARARTRLASIRAAGEASATEDAAQRAGRVGRGTEQMGLVRQAAAEVRRGQEEILGQQAASERRIGGRLLLLIVAGSLASGLLVALLAWAIRADVAEQGRGARLLKEQRNALRAANAELRVLRQEEEEARLGSERAARGESRARAMQSHFMAMTTHEIRQPINALLGFAQLLELEVAGPLTDGQRMQVTRIVAGAQHLRSLVDDFLDFAKADAGQLGVAMTDASAGEALRSAIELVTPQAAARDIHIEITDATDCGSYRGDPQRVRQVLVNLLSNAVNFTPSGGRIELHCQDAAPPATLASGSHDAWIQFGVTDTGPGIPADQLEAVFEPFVQHGTGSARPGTTGLGLTISRRLAGLMGGDLTVSSVVEQGSTFSLWLPRSMASKPHPEPVEMVV